MPRGDFGGFDSLRGFSLPGAEPSAGQDELTGDLAMRSGKWEQAVKSYLNQLVKLNALRDVQIESHGQTTVWNILVKNSAHRDEVARILRKLIQAKIGAGDLGDARRLMDRLAELNPAGAMTDDSTQTKVQPLPARLIVSAKKSDLDVVASGHLSRDEFRKQVRVNWIEPQDVTSAARPADADRPD